MDSNPNSINSEMAGRALCSCSWCIEQRSGPFGERQSSHPASHFSHFDANWEYRRLPTRDVAVWDSPTWQARVANGDFNAYRNDARAPRPVPQAGFRDRSYRTDDNNIHSQHGQNAYRAFQRTRQGRTEAPTQQQARTIDQDYNNLRDDFDLHDRGVQSRILQYANGRLADSVMNNRQTNEWRVRVAYGFLLGLAKIDLKDLPEDDKRCTICQELYGEPEGPIKLPCGQ